VTNTDDIRVALVVPVFNEAHRWNESYWLQLVATGNCALAFVNDGSTDSSGLNLSRLVARCRPREVTVLNNPQNLGKAESVRRGLNHFVMNGFDGDRDYVGFLDADGAFSLTEVERFIGIARRSAHHYGVSKPDAIFSSRVALSGRRIDRNLGRHYVARLVHTLLGIRHRNLPYDTQSGLKIFRCSPDLIQVLGVPFVTRWLFELEMILRFRSSHRSFVIREEPLEEWRDVAGSTITNREFIRIAFEFLKIVVK